MTDEELIKKYVPIEEQEKALAKLKTGYPVQYIIGNVSFCDTLIKVNENVLIPRFETEFLVAKTSELIKEKFSKDLNIIDLGTGSGAIAIALKKQFPSATVSGVDISAPAIELAKENAKINNVEVNFFLHDITLKVPGKFDLIISNPPYIPYDGYVEEKVKKYEPHLALYAIDNGLYFYKKILAYSKDILNPNFLIAFEIGDEEKEPLEKLLQENYPNYKYTFEKDLNNLDRYLFIFNE